MLSSGKFKFFDPCYALPKSFEFTLRIYLVDNFRLDKIFLTFTYPHIYTIFLPATSLEKFIKVFLENDTSLLTFIIVICD